MKKTNKRIKQGLFNNILFFLNIIVAIALCISYLAPFLNPVRFWIISFFGLSYFFLLILNLIFLLIWLVKLNKRLLLSLTSILIGWNYLGNHVQIRMGQKNTSETDKISIMTYNVNIFDIYNEWGKFDKKDNILLLIREKQPDILCLQEFVHYSNDSELATIKSLASILHDYHYYVEFLTTAKKISHFGSIIFSRYPIIDKGKISYGPSSGNISLYVDILVNNDTVRIYNVHLQSIKMKPEDYRFAEDITKIKNISKGEQLNKNLLRILQRLKNAFVKRGPQSEMVEESISKCPFPVIVCGDFNDTPSSYAYYKIKNRLTDAFTEKGSGMGKTYLGVFPSYRIDYILHSKEFKTLKFNTIKSTLSDHYPLFCEFQTNFNEN